MKKSTTLAHLLLRVGLAVAFLYAAIGGFLQPQIWIGYLPAFIGSMPEAKNILHIFSAWEIILAVWLLSGKLTKYAASIAALMLLGIVITNISDLTIIFRDLALIFAAMALVFLS